MILTCFNKMYRLCDEVNFASSLFSAVHVVAPKSRDWPARQEDARAVLLAKKEDAAIFFSWSDTVWPSRTTPGRCPETEAHTPRTEIKFERKSPRRAGDFCLHVLFERSAPPINKPRAQWVECSSIRHRRGRALRWPDLWEGTWTSRG